MPQPNGSQRLMPSGCHCPLLAPADLVLAATLIQKLQNPGRDLWGLSCSSCPVWPKPRRLQQALAQGSACLETHAYLYLLKPPQNRLVPMQGGGILPPEGKQGLAPTDDRPPRGSCLLHTPLAALQHATLVPLSPHGTGVHWGAGRCPASPLLPRHHMALGGGEMGQHPLHQSHPVCHQECDASPLPAPGQAVPPPEGHLTPEGGDQRVPLPCEDVGQRGEVRDGDREQGRTVPAPARASRWEGAHTCIAQALTRQGQFGAACKRKDRKE